MYVCQKFIIFYNTFEPFQVNYPFSLELLISTTICPSAGPWLILHKCVHVLGLKEQSCELPRYEIHVLSDVERRVIILFQLAHVIDVAQKQSQYLFI